MPKLFKTPEIEAEFNYAIENDKDIAKMIEGAKLLGFEEYEQDKFKCTKTQLLLLLVLVVNEAFDQAEGKK
jgi:hypothetical protein